LRLVSSEDVGRDEASVQSLLKKHRDISDELENYSTVIQALHEQAANLGEGVRAHIILTILVIHGCFYKGYGFSLICGV